MSYISLSSGFTLNIAWRVFMDKRHLLGIISQWVATTDLKNVGHSYLYFMVQWFSPIFVKLFDRWTPFFEIMSEYDANIDLRKM